MIIDDLDGSRRYQAFKDVFGSEEIIRVVGSRQDVINTATFIKKIIRLAESLGSMDGVRRAIKEDVPLNFHHLLGTLSRGRVVAFSLGQDRLPERIPGRSTPLMPGTIRHEL
jgi:predicted RND superfamily exporter protein